MSQDRPTGDRESRPTNAEPDESVGPAQPIRAGDGDEQAVSPPPAATSPPGEHVSRAQPMDPARRQARPPDGAGADAPRREPSSPAEERGVEDQPARRPPGRPPSSRRTRAASARGAVDRVRRADFSVVLRGYDRAAVDAYVAEVAQLVAELEATQLPETVVQRALDEVGDETSAILKRAHEAGEDIASRSRSQAESRLQRAEREAELTRKEAEDQVRKLEDDIQNVWQERQRLIEDIRTLADDVLALADDAIDRLPAPADEQDGQDGQDDGPATPGGAEGAGAADGGRTGTVAPPGGAAPTGTSATAPAPLGTPPGDPFSEEDEGEDEDLDEVTVERRPEEEDTAERPPGAAGT